jgi:hypothetical protein
MEFHTVINHDRLDGHFESPPVLPGHNSLLALWPCYLSTSTHGKVAAPFIFFLFIHHDVVLVLSPFKAGRGSHLNDDNKSKDKRISVTWLKKETPISTRQRQR